MLSGNKKIGTSIDNEINPCVKLYFRHVSIWCIFDEIGRNVLWLVALLCPSMRSVTLRTFCVTGLQWPGQSLAASHPGRSLANPPARYLHLLLCKTPTAEDAATAGYRGESQTVYYTY